MPPKKGKSVFSQHKASSTKDSKSTPASAPSEAPYRGKTASEKIDHYDRNVTSTARTRVRHIERSTTSLDKTGRCFSKSLILLNILFIFCGFGIMVYAAYAYTEQLAMLAGSQWAILSLSIGTIIMVISILGIIGSKYELRLFLLLYLILVVCVFILTFVAGCYLLSKEGHEGDFVTSGWNAASDSLRSSLEQSYFCCGFITTNDTTVACPVVSLAPCYPLLVASFKSHYNSFGITAFFAFYFLVFGGDIYLCSIPKTEYRRERTC